MPTLATNKHARHDYDILDAFEAGIVLAGAEVKAVREGNISLKGSYAVLQGDQLSLIGMHIGPYRHAGPQPGYDPVRSRRLLVHAREISKLRGKLQAEGLTLVPLAVYTKGARIKVEIGLGRGRKKFEKREAIKKRDIERQLRETLKHRPR